MKIVILDGEFISSEIPEYQELKSLGEVAIYGATSDELAARRIGDAEIVFTDSSRITADVIESCPNLRWIGIMATGCNAVDLDFAASKGIPVCNAPGYAASTVAQHGFALLLHLCSHIREYSDSVEKGFWDTNPSYPWIEHPQYELTGKTIGIIGFGDIGRKMAGIASAFGMDVTASRRSCNDELNVPGVRFASFDEVISKSDVISLNCPLREDNHRMINEEVIGKMKDGVIIINTARGGLIDEDALAAALRSGKVSAAGLDVLSQEPPDPACPLIGLDNCIVTPHIGWYSKESQHRLLRIGIDNLKTFLAGAY